MARKTTRQDIRADVARLSESVAVRVSRRVVMFSRVRVERWAEATARIGMRAMYMVFVIT